jgi:GNAT superfamily N-acetyltransferase
MSAEDHRPFAVQGLVWVAEEAGELIGFATCEAFEDELHLWELAVRLDRQGRGAGRALISAVVEEARRRGLPAVTLTTFRDIPWNAPFYSRCGFVELAEDQLGAFLTLVREKEVQLGLDVANRCAMRLAL